MILQFYAEHFRKAGEETVKRRLLKFLNGRFVPALCSHSCFGSGIGDLINHARQCIRRSQLLTMGYSSAEAECTTDLQARLLEAFEREGKLNSEDAKLLLEYQGGFIQKIEVSISLFADDEECTDILYELEKKLAGEYEFQRKEEYAKRNLEATEKSAAAASMLRFSHLPSSKRAAESTVMIATIGHAQRF
jgi:hypothetical protein